MNTTNRFKHSSDLAKKKLWNSMTISSRILAIPMLALLIIGFFFTAMIVLSMSALLSVYMLAVQ